MKKTIAFVLCVLLLCSLCSCKKEYVHTEDARTLQDAYETAFLWGLSPKAAMELYYGYFPTDDTVIYLPQSGEFKTKRGEKFTAEVSELWNVHFVKDPAHSVIFFDVSIYDENGDLIVEKKMFQSYVLVDTKKLDLTYVSEEFAPYWEAIAIRSDKISFD